MSDQSMSSSGSGHEGRDHSLSREESHISASLSLHQTGLELVTYLERLLLDTGLARDAQYLESDGLLPKTDTTVYFTGAVFSQFKPLLSSVRSQYFTIGWCLRSRGLPTLALGQAPVWSSVFRQYGCLSPAPRLGDVVSQHATLLNGAVSAYSPSAIVSFHAHVSDRDLVEQVERDVTLIIHRDGLEGFRHTYGDPHLTGRNLSVRITVQDRERDVGTVAVVHRDGTAIAVEAAFGLETVSSALCGMPSSVQACVGFSPDVLMLSGRSLAAVDLALAIAHLDLLGIRPFTTNRGRVFRSFLSAFSALMSHPSIEIRPGALLMASYVAVYKARTAPTRHPVPPEDAADRTMKYLLDRKDLMAKGVVAQDINRLLGKKWAPLWSLGGGARV
jgi:hypothetical protein